MRLEEQIKKLKITKADFLIPFIVGIIAHGYIMFSKIPNRDEFVSIFHYGSSYQFGRWFNAAVGNALFRIDGAYSTPWLNGVITLVLLTIASIVFIEPFNINNKHVKHVFTSLFVVFPSFTALMTYMHTAPMYGLAVLLCALAFFISSHKKYGFIIGVVPICFSMGVYQAYFAMLCGFIFFLFYFAIASGDDFKESLYRGLKQIAMMILALVSYLIINKIVLTVRHVELTDYQGINEMGRYAAKDYLSAIWRCYTDFFDYFRTDSYCILPYNIFNILIIIGWVGFAIMLIYTVVKLFRVNPLNGVALIVLTLFIPVAVNIINVMCAGMPDGVHMLMRTGMIFMFACPMFMTDYFELKKEAVKKYVTWGGMLVCVIAIAFYVRYSNMTYMTNELRFKQTYSTFQTIREKIQTADGYKEEYPVAFSGVYNIFPTMWEFRYSDRQTFSYTPGYVLNGTLMRKNFFAFFLGYTYNEIPINEEIVSSEEFRNMPAYPDDGSVKVINGVVVVKFSEPDLEALGIKSDEINNN